MRRLLAATRSGSGKEVLGTTAWSVAGLFGALLCGVVTARMLLPDDRGVLAILITTVTIVSLVSGLGTNISLRILLPRDPRVTMRGYAKTSLWLGALQLVFLILVSYFLLGAIDVHLGVNEVIFGVLPLGLAAFFANQTADALSATGYPSRASMANSVGFGVTAAALIAFWLLGSGLLAALLAYTAGFTTRSVIAISIIGKSVVLKTTEPRSGGTKQLLRAGVGLMGMNLGQSITYRLDQYLLAALADTRAVGLYAVATTPASLIQVVSNSVGQVAFRDSAQNQFGRKKLLIFVLGAAGVTAAYAAVMYLAAPWLIPLVFGQEYVPAVDIVRVLALAEVALSPYLVLSRAVAGAGHIKLSSLTGVVGMAAMSLFLLLFIPGSGGLGAAWACVTGYATMSLFLICGILIIRRRRPSNTPRHRKASIGPPRVSGRPRRRRDPSASPIASENSHKVTANNR